MTTTPVVYRIESKPTFRDLRGRFAQANSELLNIRREIMREQGRRLKNLVQDEAPKKTGEFARAIGFRTFVDSNSVGFTIHTPQPLGTFILKGTRRHPIPKGAGSKILRFYWENGPQGPGVYFYHHVNHPGTKPNLFVGRALRRWYPGARAALRRIALRYVRILQGKESGVRSA